MKYSNLGVAAHVPLICSFLKDTDYLVVKNDKLCIGSEINSDTDFTDILLSHFDKIASKEFKAFLKRASVVGRYFSLEEVCATMVRDQSISKDKTISKIRSMIKLCDVYGMIVEREVGKKKACNYPFQLDYMFVHSELRDSIYKSKLSDAERKSIHLKLLHYYEKIISSDNETAFLPLICYHGRFAGFLDRDSVIQHLQYCFMLGNFLCLSCEAYKETITIYTYCKQLIDYNFLEEVIGENVISEMHNRLSHAYSHGLPGETSLAQAGRHLMISIKTLKFQWPSSDSEWRRMWTSQMWFWALTNFIRPLLGRLLPKQGKSNSKWRKYVSEILGNDDFSRNSKLERLQRLQPVFEALSKNLTKAEAPMMEQTCCDLIVLNNSFRVGNYNSFSARLLMSLAIKAWFTGLRRIGKSFAERCKLNNTEPQGIAAGVFFWVSTGNWKKAKKWAQLGILLSEKFGMII